MGSCPTTPGTGCSKQSKGELNFGQNDNVEQITVQQHVDLPYRHYIGPHKYIISSLPHQQIQFQKGRRTLQLSQIDLSTILLRRQSDHIQQ